MSASLVSSRYLPPIAIDLLAVLLNRLPHELEVVLGDCTPKVQELRPANTVRGRDRKRAGELKHPPQGVGHFKQILARVMRSSDGLQERGRQWP